jgi:hypothetical protein
MNGENFSSGHPADLTPSGYLLQMSSRELLERWRNVPAIDDAALRDDIAQVVDLDI